MEAPLTLLRATVTHPWESLRQVLKQHGATDLGDPLTVGTAAWHLRHVCEVFRLQATTASDGVLTFTTPIPTTTAALVAEVEEVLLQDVDAFARWAVTLSPEDWHLAFQYERAMDLHEMLGVMMRHITWHLAAVHYWCCWRSPAVRS